jgi:hypothetical protein
MTLAEAIKEAFESENISLFRDCLDFMRYKLRYGYKSCLSAVQKVVPTVTDLQKERMLYGIQFIFRCRDNTRDQRRRGYSLHIMCGYLSDFL